MRRTTTTVSVSLLAAALPAGVLPGTTAGARAAEEKVTFADHVRPVLEAKCFSCHNTDKKKGGLDLTTFTAAMAGGSGGAVLEAGNPGASRLVQTITHQAEPFMPPEGDPLPAEQVAVIEQWIAGGLLETASSIAIKPKKPAFDLSLGEVAIGRPEGEPAMPGDLLLEPVATSPRDSAIWSIASSPWAPVVAVSGQHQVLLYHAETLALLGVLPFPDAFPHDISFSRNGELVLAAGGRGGKSGQVLVWDVRTGRRVMEVGKEFDVVLGADISADLAFVSLGGPSKKLKMFDTASTEEPFKEIGKHTEWVTAVRYSPDGVLVATADRNGNVMVWETFTGNEFHKLEGHDRHVTGLAWRADSNVLASVGEDGRVCLWEMNGGSKVKEWNAHGGVLSVDFAPDGRLITGGRDRKATIWDAEGKALHTFDGFTDLVTEVAFSHDGGRAFVADWNGHIRVFETAEGAEVGTIDPSPPALDDRIARAESRVAETEAAHREAAAAFHVALGRTESAREAVAAARGAVEEAVAAHEAAAARLSEAGQEREAGMAAHEEAAAALAAAEAESARISEEFAALTDARAEVESGLAETRRHLADWPAAIAKVRSAVEATAALRAQGSLPEIADADAHVGAALAALESAVARETEAAAALESKLADLDERLAAAESRRLAAADTVAARREAATTTAARVEAAAAALAEATGAGESARTAREQAEAAVPPLEQTLAEAESGTTDLRAAADAALADATAAAEHLAHWEAARFNVRLIAERRRLEEAEAELAAIREFLDAKPADADAEDVAEIEQKAATLATDVEASRNLVTELEATYETLRRQARPPHPPALGGGPAA